MNLPKGWRGHLWQGRFASFVMDEVYLVSATRYVGRNAMKAGLVRRAEDWAWSSAPAHVRGGDGVAESAWLAELTAAWVCTWGEYLRDEEDGVFAASMRRHERTGRPLGEKPLVRKLERLLGRPVLPKKHGHLGRRRSSMASPMARAGRPAEFPADRSAAAQARRKENTS